MNLRCCFLMLLAPAVLLAWLVLDVDTRYPGSILSANPSSEAASSNQNARSPQPYPKPLRNLSTGETRATTSAATAAPTTHPTELVQQLTNHVPQHRQQHWLTNQQLGSVTGAELSTTESGQQNNPGMQQLKKLQYQRNPPIQIQIFESSVNKQPCQSTSIIQLMQPEMHQNCQINNYAGSSSIVQLLESKTGFSQWPCKTRKQNAPAPRPAATSSAVEHSSNNTKES
ncbi:hypothetical protein Nepgr_021671 [Nepenthes gracilis]|uniref:Uncharacterized protein n=1 Tax=Nepenthes gracilis TaxID=150966 RepID=A0AAD3XXF4_NEPGR|nr:hypothetical protein Nepgr_021671 [Nepenthes gracilis]